MTNKLLVEKRFLKSADSYEKNAIVQKETAATLINHLIQYCGNQFPQIFEIGCGTGTLTQEIINKIQYKKIILNDLDSHYQNFIRQKIDDFQFISGDAELLPFPEKNDLILSNAVFQWFHDIRRMLNKCHGHLNEGGILAFSTFGPGNFHEISMITGNSLFYQEFTSLKKIIEEYFLIIDSGKEIKKIYFDQPVNVLRHIKKTGVNGVKSVYWSKKNWIDFEKKYGDFFDRDHGYPLTYEPYYFILRKEAACR